jgi:hypothetical protein
MIKQLEMTRMNATNGRIQGNCDFDKNDDNGNETNEKGKRRKKQGSKEYFKIYIYQHVHYKKRRKKARCSISKRKTKDGKFLEGPTKDDDVYMSTNSSVEQVGRVEQTPEMTRTVKKAPRTTEAATRKRKKKHPAGRSTSKHKIKKSGIKTQVLCGGQRCPKGGKGGRAPWTTVQATFRNGLRVWDAERTAREGGGGPARVAKFRDRSTQQLGSAADSTPVVL